MVHWLSLLLRQNPQAIHARDPASGDTVLIASVRQSNAPIVKCLLEHGASLSDPTHEGFGILELAVRRWLAQEAAGDAKSVETLDLIAVLIRHLDRAAPDPEQLYRSLILAVENDALALIDVLFKSKTDIPNLRPLLADVCARVAQDAQAPLFKRLLDRLLLQSGPHSLNEDWADRSGCGSSPLHAAAAAGNAEQVSCLIYEGVAVNPPIDQPCLPEYLETPLMNAARIGSCECVEILLEHGAVPNQMDQDGETALHKLMASVSEKQDNRALLCTGLLLEAGADPSVQNRAEISPLDLAQVRNLDLLYALMRDYCK